MFKSQILLFEQVTKQPGLYLSVSAANRAETNVMYE
jgi:hypothetical protein